MEAERAYNSIKNGSTYEARMANPDLRNREKEYATAKYQRRIHMVNIIKLMSGCVDCGYDKHPAALEFDHLPGTVKYRDIGKLYMQSLKVLFTEIAKCEVVCANCHRIRTATRDQYKNPGVLVLKGIPDG
jgi:hypothetical protein